MLSVLVVDDNPGFRSQMCENLERRGWAASSASTGEEALRVLEEPLSGYDAVVLDRAMPGLTGDEVIRHLRAKKEFLNTCIVMATAFKDAESAIAALKLGAFEYLIKPIKPQVLDSVLRAGVAWHRAHRMRGEILRSLDRNLIVDRITRSLAETTQSARVQLTLADYAGSCIAADLTDRFGGGEQVIFKTGRSGRSGPHCPEQVGSMIAVAIRGTGDRLRGVLSIETEVENDFSRSWVDVLRYYADLVGIALELGSEFDKLRDMYREWRHKIATNVQIVAMQARQLQKLSLTAPGTESESIRQRVRFIVDNAGVIETFAQDIKAFAAEPGQPSKEPVNVPEIVQSAVDEQRPDLDGARIVVIVEADSGPVLLRTDRDWLSYSLRCLIRNAAESIRDARRERAAGSEDAMKLTVSYSESHVEIRVRDSGIGFDEETHRQIFKPLFSTKTASLPDSAGESNGVERVERVLALMSNWVGQDPRGNGIPADLGRGMELLVRDGEVVEMFVGHREKGGLDTARLAETSLCRVGLDSPLAPEWRGRGEGLYTVQKYISALGGYVSASSDGWDKGAEFRISLPRE